MRIYLKNLRRKRGISQVEISKMLGVSQSYYNLIERYRRKQNMDLMLVLALCDILMVPPDYIIEQELILQSKTRFS